MSRGDSIRVFFFAAWLAASAVAGPHDRLPLLPHSDQGFTCVLWLAQLPEKESRKRDPERFDRLTVADRRELLQLARGVRTGDLLAARALADKLEELGDERRARFVRLQAAMVELLDGHDPQTLPEDRRKRHGEYRREAEALLANYGREWQESGLRDVFPYFERGLVTTLLLGDAVVRGSPVDREQRAYRLFGRYPDTTAMLFPGIPIEQAEPLLRAGAGRLEEIAVGGSEGFESPLGKIAASTPRLKAVRLSGRDTRDLEALGRAAPKLERLDFLYEADGSAQTSRAIGRALNRHAAFESLVDLEVRYAMAVVDPAEPFVDALLANGKKFPRLRKLDLSLYFSDGDLAKLTPARFPALEALVVFGAPSPRALADLVQRFPTLKSVSPLPGAAEQEILRRRRESR